MKSLIVQLARFGLVGIINTSVGLLAIYSIIFFFNSGPILANLIGYAIGLVISFYLNKLWTFTDNTSKTKVLPRYLIVAAISYLCNLAMVFVGVNFFKIGPYLVQIFGISVYTFIMFIGCKWYVFKRH
jgi:putative flippase GtrA